MQHLIWPIRSAWLQSGFFNSSRCGASQFRIRRPTLSEAVMSTTGIVPAWSQAYDLPRLPFLVRDQGPIHTQETSESDEQLYQALTTVAGIAKRDPASPPPLAARRPPESTAASAAGPANRPLQDHRRSVCMGCERFWSRPMLAVAAAWPI